MLRLAATHRFQSRDFHELSSGELRVLSPLLHAVSETLPAWGRVIRPHAETVAHLSNEQLPGRASKRTPLTQANRRTAVRRAKVIRAAPGEDTRTPRVR
jgi:3-deoxy-D-manno-octulosonic-acid transferase